jgi:hypothetical protein
VDSGQSRPTVINTTRWAGSGRIATQPGHHTTSRTAAKTARGT